MNTTCELGELRILSVARGDTKITFDGDDAEQVAMVKETITDMLAKGYAIFVADEDGKLRKVSRFDPKTCEYIVRGRAKSRKKTPPKRYKAGRSKATAIAPTAGG